METNIIDRYNNIIALEEAGFVKSECLDVNKNIAFKETNDKIYLEIPDKWKDIYYKLSTIIINNNIELITDCTSLCKHKYKQIIICWNLFQSAILAEDLGKTKESNIFINYITKTINNYEKTYNNKK